MQPRKLRNGILVADLVWAAPALIIASALRFGFEGHSRVLWHPFAEFGFEFIAALIVWSLLYERMGLDGFRGGWYFPAIFSRIFLGVSAVMVVMLAAAYLARTLVSRLVLCYFGLLLFVGFAAIRWAVQLVLRSKLITAARRRVVIAGSGRTAVELGRKIERHPEILCHVVGYLRPADTDWDRTKISAGLIAVQALGIVDLLKAQRADELILVGQSFSRAEMLNLAARCRNEGIHVSLVPELYELYLSKPFLMDLDGLPVLQLPQTAPLLGGGIKRSMDLALVFVLAAPAAAILLLSAILLRLQKGSVFRWEVRCGKHGHHFQMLRLNVERETLDPTLLERVLHHLSITELPQLWNVVTGEMSLVGPRPESPWRVQAYTEWERQRLAVKPGITGLAQVHGLRELNSSEDKCRFDLQYILDCSPLLDLSLVLQTIWTLVTRSSHFGTGSDSPEVPQGGDLISMQEVVQHAHRTQSSAD